MLKHSGKVLKQKKERATGLESPRLHSSSSSSVSFNSVNSTASKNSLSAQKGQVSTNRTLPMLLNINMDCILSKDFLFSDSDETDVSILCSFYNSNLKLDATPPACNPNSDERKSNKYPGYMRHTVSSNSKRQETVCRAPITESKLLHSGKQFGKTVTHEENKKMVEYASQQLTPGSHLKELWDSLKLYTGY